MHCIVMVIGKCLHVIENDPEDHENGKPGDELAGGGRQVVKRVEQCYQYQLLRFESNKK